MPQPSAAAPVSWQILMPRIVLILSWSMVASADGRCTSTTVSVSVAWREEKIEIDSSIWREEMQNRNRLLDLAGRNT